jgi:hypothetical protein
MVLGCSGAIRRSGCEQDSARQIETREVVSDDFVMQRMLSIGLAVGLVTVGVWALVRRLRSRTTRDDLGTVSNAWLHNPRSYTDTAE